MVSSLKIKIKGNPFTIHLMRILADLRCSGVVILRYHSVKKRAATHPDYLMGIVHDDQSFAEHMHIISREFDPVSMGEILDMANGRIKIPRRGIAVTFDDGFADNCEVAMPIMDHYGIKGCVYVTSGHVESGNCLWFMRLRHAFGTTALKVYSGTDGTVYHLDMPTQRRAAFLESSGCLAKLVGEKQLFALSLIEKKLDVVPLDPGCRVILSWDQMRRMQRQGHAIGCHTLSHANIAHIDETELEQELVESRRILENNLETPIEHFAYPKPILSPYFTERTQQVLMRSGYRTIATCEPGIYRGGNPLKLPRISAPIHAVNLRWAIESTRIRLGAGQRIDNDDR